MCMGGAQWVRKMHTHALTLILWCRQWFWWFFSCCRRCCGWLCCCCCRIFPTHNLTLDNHAHIAKHTLFISSILHFNRIAAWNIKLLLFGRNFFVLILFLQSVRTMYAENSMWNTMRNFRLCLQNFVYILRRSSSLLSFSWSSSSFFVDFVL